MGFRDIFLEQLAKRRQPVGKRPIDAAKLQAFTKKDLETAVQLYRHLKDMGNTLDDLVTFLEAEKLQAQKVRVLSAMQSAVYLTREQRRHAKKGGGKRSRRNDSAQRRIPSG